jgi:quercetin dioxygenase-like cupin family protein
MLERLVNGGLKRTWEEGVMAYFEIPSQHLCEAEGNQETPVGIAGVRVEILVWYLPNTKQEPNDPDYLLAGPTE